MEIYLLEEGRVGRDRCLSSVRDGEFGMNTMPVSEIIEKVTAICKKNGVKRLDLFGSFATGTATPSSDIDFVVY